MVAKRSVATKHVGLISGLRVSVVQGCRVQDQGAGGVQWWRVQAGVQSADFQSVVRTLHTGAGRHHLQGT